MCVSAVASLPSTPFSGAWPIKPLSLPINQSKKQRDALSASLCF